MEQEKPFWQNPWRVFKTTLMASAGLALCIAAINVIPGTLAAATEGLKVSAAKFTAGSVTIPLPTSV